MCHSSGLTVGIQPTASIMLHCSGQSIRPINTPINGVDGLAPCASKVQILAHPCLRAGSRYAILSNACVQFCGSIVKSYTRIQKYLVSDQVQCTVQYNGTRKGFNASPIGANVSTTKALLSIALSLNRAPDPECHTMKKNVKSLRH